MAHMTRCRTCYGFNDNCPECGGSGFVEYSEGMKSDRRRVVVDVLVTVVLICCGIAFWYELIKTVRMLW
jgi:hypothetical protein